MPLQAYVRSNRVELAIGCLVGGAVVLFAQLAIGLASRSDTAMHHHWGMLSEHDMQVLLHRLDFASDKASVFLVETLVTRFDANRDRARHVLTVLAEHSSLGDGARALALRSLLTDYRLAEVEHLQVARNWLQSRERFDGLGEVPAATAAIDTLAALGGSKDADLLEDLAAPGVPAPIREAAAKAIDIIRRGDSLNLQPRIISGDDRPEGTGAKHEGKSR